MSEHKPEIKRDSHATVNVNGGSYTVEFNASSLTEAALIASRIEFEVNKLFGIGAPGKVETGSVRETLLADAISSPEVQAQLRDPSLPDGAVISVATDAAPAPAKKRGRPPKTQAQAVPAQEPQPEEQPEQAVNANGISRNQIIPSSLVMVDASSGPAVLYVQESDSQVYEDVVATTITGEEFRFNYAFVTGVRQVQSSSGIAVGEGAAQYVSICAGQNKVPNWTDVWDALTRLDVAGTGVRAGENGEIYVLNKAVIQDALANAKPAIAVEPPAAQKPAPVKAVKAEPVKANGAAAPKPAGQKAAAPKTAQAPAQAPQPEATTESEAVEFGVGWVVTYQPHPGQAGQIRSAVVLDPNGDDIEVRDITGMAEVIPRASITKAMQFVADNGSIDDHITFYQEECAKNGRKPSWTDIVLAHKVAYDADQADVTDGRPVLSEGVLELALDIANHT